MITYHRFLINLAKAQDIEAAWRSQIKKEDRMESGKAIRKYIQQSWSLMYTNPMRFVPRGNNELTRDQLIKLTNFFFIPKEVIRVYAFE